MLACSLEVGILQIQQNYTKVQGKQKTIGGTGVNTLTCSVEKGKNPWGSPHKSVNLSLYNYTKWFKNMFETSKNIIGYS